MLWQQELGKGERVMRFGRCGRLSGACFVVTSGSPEASSWLWGGGVFGEEPLVMILLSSKTVEIRDRALWAPLLHLAQYQRAECPRKSCLPPTRAPPAGGGTHGVRIPPPYTPGLLSSATAGRKNSLTL